MNVRVCGITTLLLLLFFSTLAFAENAPPSNDVIQKWWKQHSQEKLEIDGAPVLIKLRNKEEAFLVPVYFIQRGRNDIDHTVLVRPVMKEVREVADPVRRDSVAHDLNHDGISEIETSALGSGQGTTEGAKSIVQFEGWEPIVLHQMEFNDNLGCCGPPTWGCGPCVSTEVKWKFVDLDGDGNDDLIEEVIIMKGPQTEKLSTKKKTNKYLFKNNAFIKIKGNVKTK